MSLSIENLPACIQPELCELALSQISGLPDRLSAWVTTKYTAFNEIFGQGTVNLNHSKVPAIAKIVELPEEQIKNLLFRIRTDETVLTAARKGNAYPYSPGGQLALLTMLGIFADTIKTAALPQIGQLRKFEESEVIDLARRAKTLWGTSCIARYYKLPGETQPLQIEAPDRPQTTATPNPSPSTIRTDRTQKKKTSLPLMSNAKYVPPSSVSPVVTTSSALKENPKINEAVPSPNKIVIIKGINHHDFPPTAVDELKGVRLSAVSAYLEQLSRRSTGVDSIITLNGSVTNFLKYWANLARADRHLAQYDTLNGFPFYTDDIDLTLHEIKAIWKQVTDCHRKYLEDSEEKISTLSDEDRALHLDPPLSLFYTGLVRYRKSQGKVI